MKWSRRRRRLAWVTGSSLAFVVLVGTWLALRSGDGGGYRPGEDVDGLTSALTRNLPDDAPALLFSSVADEAGIRFSHFTGTRSRQLPEDMGSGAAWGDFDSDGFPDLYLVDLAGTMGSGGTGEVNPPAVLGEGGNRLFRNKGDGTFQDVTETSGTGLVHLGSGAAWADCDADGDADLLVTGYGDVVLFRNRGDGTFARSAVGDYRGFWAGASWGDYDRDGDPDAYVTGYVRYREGLQLRASMQYQVEQPESLNPSAFEPERNLLLQNDGTCGLRDVAEAAGVANPDGRSLSAAWVDANRDGWPDLYVANDVSDNVLFLNDGDGTFQDISHAATVADYRGAMGIAVGDWNGDALDDLFITHWIAQENALFEARPDAFREVAYMDVADRVGLGQVALDFVGWATGFADFDRDGRQDLFVVNGSTLQDSSGALVPMRDQLFWNAGPERGFFELPVLGGAPAVGRGGAFADYDRDGDMDLVVVHHGGPAVLWRNDTELRSRWLGVLLDGPPDAHGARVSVWQGGVAVSMTVGTQPSYLSLHDAGLLFGLSDVADVDSVTVVWPSSARVVVSEPGVDAWLRVNASGLKTRVQGMPSGRARERVFWETYRSATQERLAGRHADALPLLEYALKLNPEHRDAQYYLGNVLLELGRHEDALVAFRGLSSQETASARGLRQAGSLQFCYPQAATFDPAGARIALQAAWRVNREETGVQMLLAQLDVLEQDRAEARRQLEGILTTHPENTLAAGLLDYLRFETDGTAGTERLQAARALEAPVLPGATAEGDGGTMGQTTSRCPLFDGFAARIETATDVRGEFRALAKALGR